MDPVDVGAFIQDDHVVNRKTKERVPPAGARATVETSGQLEKHVTATRLILTGPFAFGLRKKSDNRQLFLTVKGDGAGFTIEIAGSAQMVAAPLS